MELIVTEVKTKTVFQTKWRKHRRVKAEDPTRPCVNCSLNGKHEFCDLCDTLCGGEPMRFKEIGVADGE